MTATNQAQTEAWNGDSGRRWTADADRRDAIHAPVADALQAAAELRAGEDVLDIGCGCGATTLAAAKETHPGTVTGIDLSGPMLDLARQRTGNANTLFLQADAQTHPFARGSFDVAISRFGTMFFDDPTAAFANIASAMRNEGRLCLATWQPLAANDWLTIPGATLLRYGSLPDTSGAAPGMFAQSDQAVITDVLRAAGWQAIDVDPISITLRLGANAEDATQYLANTGIARTVLDSISPSDRQRAIDDVTVTLAEHASADGVRLRAGLNIIRARASSTP